MSYQNVIFTKHYQSFLGLKRLTCTVVLCACYAPFTSRSFLHCILPFHVTFYSVKYLSIATVQSGPSRRCRKAWFVQTKTLQRTVIFFPPDGVDIRRISVVSGVWCRPCRVCLHSTVGKRRRLSRFHINI